MEKLIKCLLLVAIVLPKWLMAQVGIGTTTPSSPLHILQSGGEGLRIETTHTDNLNWLQFEDDGLGGLGYVGFGSGSNTSLYINNQRNDDIRFWTNSSERMIIKSTGNVGIGTADPDAPLDVRTASIHRLGNWDSKLQLTSTGANDFPALIFANHTTGRYGGIFWAADESGNSSNEIAAAIIPVPTTATTTDLTFATNATVGTGGRTEQVRITSSGNVGIGTTAPGEKLHIASSTFAGLRLQGAGDYTGSDWVLYSSSVSAPSVNDFFGIYNNSTTDGASTGYKMIVHKNGRVGIGTTSPSTVLDVYPDLNNSAQVGKAHIGYMGFSDYAGFSHVDRDGVNYALMQHAGGSTFLNAGSGTPIYFRIANSDKMLLNTTGLGIGTTSPAEELHVVGSIRMNDGAEAAGNIMTSDANGVASWVTPASLGLGGDGIYGGSGTTPSNVDVTVTDNIDFDGGTLFIDGTNNRIGVGTSAPTSKLDVRDNTVIGDGVAFGDARISISGTNGDNDAAFVAARKDGTTDPVLAIMPWISQVYISSGVYFDDGVWTHHSDDGNNQIFTLDPGGGVRWYASNNSTGSWNVASNEQLWDDAGNWKNLVQSTQTGDSYFIGGDVGIGTTTPSSPLHIVQSGGEGLRIETTHANNLNWIQFEDDGLGGLGYIGYGSSGNTALYINNQRNDDIRFWTNSNEQMTIKNTGNVGIGTNTPIEKLHIASSTYAGLRLQGAGNYAGSDWTLYSSSASAPSADDFIGIYNNSATDGATVGYKMVVHKNGNVGIGTTTPTSRLEVFGGDFYHWDNTEVYQSTTHDNGGANLANNTSVFQREIKGRLNGGVSTLFREQVRYNGDGTTRRGDYQAGVAQTLGFGGTQFRMTQTAADNSKITLLGNVSSYNPDLAVGAYSVKASNVINNTQGRNILQLDASGNTLALFTASGDLGIGTLTPSYKLHAVTSDSYDRAIHGESTGAGSGVGVYGESAGTGVGICCFEVIGVQGVKSGNTSNPTVGFALKGTATGTAATNYGIGATASGANANLGGSFTATGGSTTIGITTSASGGSGSNIGLQVAAGETVITDAGASAPTRTLNGSLGTSTSGGNRIYFRTGGTNYYVSSSGTGDYSEFFRTDDITLEVGEIVAIDTKNHNAVRRADATEGDAQRIMGIVSKYGTQNNNTNDGDRHEDSAYVNIGLLGQVQLLVSTENGDIAPGDALTLSNTKPGVAVKAKYSSRIIGYAMTHYPYVEGEETYPTHSGAKGKKDNLKEPHVMVYVQAGYWYSPSDGRTEVNVLKASNRELSKRVEALENFLNRQLAVERLIQE